jgi:sugar phosphate isomerase/epimerase
MNERNAGHQDEVIREAFRLLGPRIVSAHAKDYRLRAEDGKLIGTAAGLGELNYPLFWELLERHKPHGFVTLEGVEEEQLPGATRFVLDGRQAARARLLEIDGR